MPRFLRLALALGLVLWLSLLLGAGAAGANEGEIYVLRVQGPIVPIVADYIHRGLAQAERKGAQALIIELDTPGGLVSSSQKIIQDFLRASVPVVVYVSPAGGWAGSAGAFITLAAHVAAMAPGTFIGAAHPVSIGPEGAQAVPSAIEEKTVNALASAIRSIAEKRQRNVEVAEDMVRQSVAQTDSEALELNLIDLRSDSLRELLEQLEGREIELPGGETVTLHLADAGLRRIGMNPVERLLQAVSDPNIAYILLSLAMLALFVELSSPGAIFPGVAGGIGLLLALYSLGALEVQIAGILLVVLAFGLFLADVFFTSHGILTAGGIVSLAMGSFILFPESSVLQLNRWLVAGLVILITIFFVFVLAAIVRTHRQPQVTGREGMVGLTAVVKTPLEPKGTVSAHGEIWQATIDEGRAEPGEEVSITGIQGLKLRVSRKKTKEV